MHSSPFKIKCWVSWLLWSSECSLWFPKYSQQIEAFLESCWTQWPLVRRHFSFSIAFDFVHSLHIPKLVLWFYILYASCILVSERYHWLVLLTRWEAPTFYMVSLHISYLGRLFTYYHQIVSWNWLTFPNWFSIHQISMLGWCIRT